MPKSKSTSKVRKKTAPPMTAEGREQELINLSMINAEKQLREGTASSQIIVHFLKLGASKTELENEKLRQEIEFLKTKKESIESEQRSEERYQEAIDAFRRYSGYNDSDT